VHLSWAKGKIYGVDEEGGGCLCGEQEVQGVAVVLEGNPGPRRDLRDVDRLVQIHHVLPLRVNLHQDLVLAHHLHAGGAA